MRSILIVLDSLGIGAAPDADRHGDWGADTLGHIFAQSPDLALPSLFSLGLGEVLAGGRRDEGIHASYGRMRTASAGKDSTSGHWEMAGVVLKQPFTIYDRLPPQLIEAIEAEAKVSFLGKDGRSEDEKAIWKEHAATGRPVIHLPIGESAIEIRAHEGVMARTRLYEICRLARRHANLHRMARVTAQPMTGKPGAYTLGAGRHEYPVTPPRTVLNAISEAGLVVEGIGKIPDLFGRSGVTHGYPAQGNTAVMEMIDRVWERTHDGLVFANLPDFDTHGHARDVAGYAAALKQFDAWLAGFLPRIVREDLLIITADHGNDPVFRGRDHTREEVPVLVHYDGVTGWLGTRDTLADIAATLSEYFRLRERWPFGRPLMDFRKTRKTPVRLKN